MAPLWGQTAQEANPFSRYQTDPIAYAETELKFFPWAGRDTAGQRELFADIGASVRAQLAGEPTPRIFRVAAGHGIGKTLGAAALVNWWFDAFAPSICITTAPTKTAVVEKLWKNIKTLRGRHLPGRVLPAEPRMEKAPNHFAIGQTTSNSGGQGTERFQGQHDQYLFFVLDEAEGIAAYVYDAIHAMMTGGRVLLCLALANPRTRSSRFHRLATQPGVKNYHLSVLDFPNVLDGRDTIPGGTSREWVIGCVQQWCKVAPGPNPDAHTFTLPFAVPPPQEGAGCCGSAGTHFLPNAEFLFRVAGVAPANTSSDTFLPAGRFQAACERARGDDRPEQAWIGIDAAGYGSDLGTLYVRHNGAVWRAATCSKPDGDQDPTDYWQKARTAAFALAAQGVTHLSVRIDAGGGFGNGVYDRLKRDEGLRAAFGSLEFHLVHFGGTPQAPKSYRDLGTQMYAEAAEACLALSILKPPAALEGDLCERRYEWVNWQGIEVKKLTEKKQFRREQGRSPDDGDGFALCVCPDFLFAPLPDRPRYSPIFAAAKGW